MRKFLGIIVTVFLCFPVFSQEKLPEHQFASGSWQIQGDRLYQNDQKAPLAKVNIRLPQSGEMTYAFDARYEGGVEDGHGGFGIHIFADRAFPRKSWGVGKSYLLWINYDEKPMDSRIPKGFSVQVYRSESNTRMDLIESVDLNEFKYLLTPENVAQPLPIRISANSDTGEIRVYDPTDPTNYFYFNVDKKNVPLSGSWIALRTNGLKMSFGLLDPL